MTRTYLPELSEYTELLEGVWHRGQVTNNGPLLQELEDSLVPHHGTDHVLFVGNGTIALQLALRALDITGESTLELIEADPMAGQSPAPVIRDADWVRLQGICGS